MWYNFTGAMNKIIWHNFACTIKKHMAQLCAHYDGN